MTKFLNISTDRTLGGSTPSDSTVSSQKAIKNYIADNVPLNKATGSDSVSLFGIGADGIVLVRKSIVADIKMVIVNSDGSAANMCGNAIRCFGKYVFENNIISKEIIKVETGDGIKELELKINNNNKAKCFGNAHFNINQG